MDEARSELQRIIQDREMKDALLLVFANKQDIKGGTSEIENAELAVEAPPSVEHPSLHLRSILVLTKVLL